MEYDVAINDFLLRGLDIPMLTENNPGIVSIDRPKGTDNRKDIRVVIVDYLKSL